MMTAAPRAQAPLPSMLRVAWLIVALGLRRWANRSGAIIGRRRSHASGRAATDRRRRPGAAIAAIVAAVTMLVLAMTGLSIVHSVVMSEQRADSAIVMVDDRTMIVIDTIESLTREGRLTDSSAGREALRRGFDDQLRRDGVADAAERAARVEQLVRLYDERGRDAFRVAGLMGSLSRLSDGDLWSGAGASIATLGPLSLIALLLTIGVGLLSIAGPDQDLARAEWTFEWWFTFPVEASGLLLARIVETAVANPLPWSIVFPFLTVVYWTAGYAWAAVPLGLVATLYIGLLIGSLRVAAETVLRRALSLRTIARIQAVLATVAVVPLIAALAATSPAWLAKLIALAQHLPPWLLVNPFDPISLAAGGTLVWTTALGCTLLAIGSTIGATAIGGWMLRDGLTSAAGPEGERGRSAARDRRRGTMIDPVARKELQHLLRDRTRFASALVVPALVLGSQLLISPLPAGAVDGVELAIALAFSAAVLVLVAGACGTLALEVPALWLLYTFPLSLDRLLARKAVFWGCIASLYSLVVFVVIVRADPALILAAASVLPLMVGGVMLNAFIATAMGALGTDALEAEPRRRMRQSMVLLFMVVAGLFVYALYTPSPAAKLVQVVLSASLAYALWQKLRDHAPLLLDPGERPPPAIAVADGLIAAQAFFVLQAVLGLGFSFFELSQGVSILFAFAGAGILVAGAMLARFWRSRLPDLLASLGLERPRQGLARGLLEGVAGGGAAAVIAAGYLLAVEKIGPLRHLRADAAAPLADAVAAPWLVALAVLAAPVFEEFIFRGVLYAGFRRSLDTARAAVFTAAVFAIVHPLASWAPVFVLGAVAAVAYERSRSLLVPAAAHMTYNAIVVATLPLIWRV